MRINESPVDAAPGGEDRANTETPRDGRFWVPLIESRRETPVRAEFVEEGEGLAKAATDAASNPKQPGSKLGMVILNPEHGIIGEGDEIDAWGGARLQLALEQAFRAFRGSVDELARDAQAMVKMMVPNVRGLDRLVDIIRGARATVDYIGGHPLGQMSRRLTSIELDVLAQVDLLEVDYGKDGKIDEIRLVQIKASEESARAGLGIIVGTHQKLLLSYQTALAEVLGAEAAAADRDESPVSRKHFDAVVAALAQGPEAIAAALSENVEAHLALKLGQKVPGFRRHLEETRRRTVAAQLFAAAENQEIPTFRVEELANEGTPPPLGAFVRTGENPTRFISVVATGSKEVARRDISRSFHGGGTMGVRA